MNHPISLLLELLNKNSIKEAYDMYVDIINQKPDLINNENDWSIILQKLIEGFTYLNDSESCLKVIDLAQEYIESIDRSNYKQNSLLLKLMHAKSIVLYNLRKYEDSFNIAHQLLCLSVPTFQNDFIARAASTLGKIYNDLGDNTKAIKYRMIAIDALKNSNEKRLKAMVLSDLANIHIQMSNYEIALPFLEDSMRLYKEIDDNNNIGRIYGTLGIIYFHFNNYSIAEQYYKKAIDSNSQYLNKKGLSTWTGNLGVLYCKINDFIRGEEYLLRAINISNEIGGIYESLIWQNQLAEILSQNKQYDKALEIIKNSISVLENAGLKEYALSARSQLCKILSQSNYYGYSPIEAETILLNNIQEALELDLKVQAISAIEILMSLYENQERWKEAYEKKKQFDNLKDLVFKKETENKILHFSNQAELENHEKEHEELLVTLKAKERLLLDLLPKHIAERKIAGEDIIAESIEDISILFCDIVGFTELSSRISPEEVTKMLNEIYTAFDKLAEKYGIEKIKTIGDCYMASCGINSINEHHKEQILQFAFDLITMSNTQLFNNQSISLRIGIHNGQVIAGIIGQKKFTYDIWGDSVNTASRMEHYGEKDKIHISEEFANNLSPLKFILEKRNPLEIKGKGRMQTYFVYKK